MRKIVYVASVAVMSSLIFSTAAQADDIYAKYNFSTDTVSVWGNTESYKELMSFMVLPDGVTPEKLTPDTADKYIFYELRNESDGSFDFDVQLPKDTDAGKYNVYAFYDDDIMNTEFTYLKDADLRDFAQKINSMNVSGVCELLKNNSTKIGLKDDSLPYSDQIADFIKSAQPSGGYSSNTLFEELGRSSALARLINGADISDIMREYGEYFGKDASDIIASMSDNQKNTFTDYIKNNQKTKNTKQLFYRAVMMSGIINSGNYVVMSECITKYRASTGLSVDLSRATPNTYNQLYTAIKNSGIATFEAMESKLKSLLSANNQSAGTGGGGGGGGTVSTGATPSGSGNAVIATTSANDTSVVRLTYNDIQSHWGRTYIEKLSKLGIIAGYDDGSFRPDKNVTRAEFTKLVVSTLGEKSTSAVSFGDVSPSDWYYSYICAGYSSGLITGDNGKFRPNDLITRQDAAVILYRAINGNINGDATLTYSDAQNISDYAKDAVSYLSERGLLSGSDGKFLPKNNTTRAQAATMLCKLIERMGR